ncbi:hypothetical protein [uncultured Zhongshania sp.]|uniref:hypothetical protein n=1 Tax=uncultured Zhongshania sp. TaxID=1642288 RepID=UPI0030DB77BB
MAFAQNKVTLCWPNLIDKCTLTSAATYTRPLNRLQRRVLKDRAITTDTTFDFTATLDTSRPVAVAGLLSHNLSVTAQWRIRLYDDADELLEDSGLIDVWPSVFQSAELAWEDDNFWEGKPSEEDRARFTPQAIWFAETAWFAAKALIDISDDDNADGYIQIGRAFLSDVFQPEYNISYGVRWGHADPSEIDRVPDGTEYFNKLPKARECSMVFDWLNEAEAFGRLFRLQRDVGITDEIIFSQQLNQDIIFLQRTMLCRLGQIDPVTHPDAARYTNALSLTEIL